MDGHFIFLLQMDPVRCQREIFQHRFGTATTYLRPRHLHIHRLIFPGQKYHPKFFLRQTSLEQLSKVLTKTYCRDRETPNELIDLKHKFLSSCGNLLILISIFF